jgi:hypothetical protein
MAQRKSTSGPVAAARLLGKVMSPALRRRGFAEGQVIERWSAIVGPELAEVCVPEKLTFARNQAAGGTLHIRVAGASAVRLQHLLPQILERVNGFYGYRAVGRVRLLQAPLPPRQQKPRRESRSLSAIEQRALDEMTAGIGDSRLQSALRRLGEAVSARAPAPREPS